MREGGMQGGTRMLRVAAGASPARYSCSKALAPRRRERSGTWQTGPWGAPQACGVSLQWCCMRVWCPCGSVLIVSHSLLCGRSAGSKLLIFSTSPCFRQGEKALIIDESDGVAVCLEHDACGGSGLLGGWPAECEACGGRPGLWECHPCRKYVPALALLPSRCTASSSLPSTSPTAATRIWSSLGNVALPD